MGDKAIEMPSGVIITFGGVDDHKIMITKKGSKMHATFTIGINEYDFHATERRKGLEDHVNFFKINKDFFTDMIKQNLDNAEVSNEGTKGWITKKDKYILDIDSQNYALIERRQEDFWDVFPEVLPKHAISPVHISRLKFSMGAIYNSDGRCQGLMIPAHHSKYELWIVPREFLDLILDGCIGTAYVKGYGHAILNEDSLHNISSKKQKESLGI